ncbi:DUF732 domain-containing protein [Mycobacterium sp. NPDC051804]|uniref:DUF732 domain-containing protein n=1 Tax=Mycobacterium sp. NPDC051804 TaxID=3364295 RepID=UPI0037A41536
MTMAQSSQFTSFAIQNHARKRQPASPSSTRGVLVTVRRTALLAAAAAAVSISLPQIASADTIDEMVENTGALESPFWSRLHENGFGYLNAQRVSNDGKIACVNRQAGVPPDQVALLLRSRDYTDAEAWEIVQAEMSSSTSVHSVC